MVTTVIGATGPTGSHLVDALLGRRRPVRVVSRDLARLESLFPQADERVAADALDAEATARAVAGSGVVVDCIGLPPERMGDHERTARIVAEAARAAGARCLQVSSYWAFIPHLGEVVSEAHPRQGGHAWFRHRRAAEDAVLAAGGAVVHLPDFFGPRVHTSSVQGALEEAAAGETVNWLGGADVEREVAFVPDVMAIVADLLERDETWGTDWALPGSGRLSGKRLAAIATAHLGRPVTLRAAPAWLLKVLGLFNAQLRTIQPMVPHYVRPVRYDTTKVRRLLGEPRLTPLDRAIETTLDWLRDENG